LRANAWTLRELVALIAGSNVFVGNDSGPAHIAAAAGIPVLVIFGSSDSLVWRPWKAERAVVVQNDFECNPCPGDLCYAFAEPRCILSIATEQVTAGLESLLGAIREGS
jgi:ADP-heptose:LPS heptosyltransferase